MNIFDKDLSKVPGALYLSTKEMPRTCEPDIFFDSRRFLTHIILSYEYIDVLTYNNTYRSAKIRRVMYSVGTAPRFSNEKRVENLHSKLYICYAVDNNVEDIYIGSQNLVQPTEYLEVMLKVQSTLHPYLTEYFDNLWKQATL
jgi:hypothetical protein